MPYNVFAPKTSLARHWRVVRVISDQHETDDFEPIAWRSNGNSRLDHVAAAALASDAMNSDSVLGYHALMSRSFGHINYFLEVRSFGSWIILENVTKLLGNRRLPFDQKPPLVDALPTTADLVS